METVGTRTEKPVRKYAHVFHSVKTSQTPIYSLKKVSKGAYEQNKSMKKYASIFGTRTGLRQHNRRYSDVFIR